MVIPAPRVTFATLTCGRQPQPVAPAKNGFLVHEPEPASTITAHHEARMTEHDADLCDDAFDDAEMMAHDEYEMFVDIRTDALNFAIATSTPDEQPQDVVFRAQVYADWISGKFTLQNRYEPAAPATSGDNVVAMTPPKGKLQ